MKLTLDRNTSTSFKGILAILILLCHLHARVELFTHSILGTLFTALGYLCVGAFFFLSGYGLNESLTKQDYLAAFPRRKLLPFFLVCCFTVALYVLRDLLVGSSIQPKAVLQSFLFGKTVVDHGWYLQAQLLFYIIFYLIYRFVPEYIYIYI